MISSHLHSTISIYSGWSLSRTVKFTDASSVNVFMNHLLIASGTAGWVSSWTSSPHNPEAVQLDQGCCHVFSSASLLQWKWILILIQLVQPYQVRYQVRLFEALLPTLQLPLHNFCLTFPWILINFLTFSWQLLNSLTFPGFPDKWLPYFVFLGHLVKAECKSRVAVYHVWPCAVDHVGQEYDTLPVHMPLRRPCDFLSALLPLQLVHHSQCRLELCTSPQMLCVTVSAAVIG